MAGLLAGPAVLVVEVLVTCSGAGCAGTSTGLHLRPQQPGVDEVSGKHARCRARDVRGIQVATNASSELGDIRFHEARVRTRDASDLGLEARLHAFALRALVEEQG